MQLQNVVAGVGMSAISRYLVSDSIKSSLIAMCGDAAGWFMGSQSVFQRVTRRSVTKLPSQTAHRKNEPEMCHNSIKFNEDSLQLRNYARRCRMEWHEIAIKIGFVLLTYLFLSNRRDVKSPTGSAFISCRGKEIA